VLVYYLEAKQGYTVRKMKREKLIWYILISKSIEVPLHAMEALGGEEA
jgi:hypothetical protein